MVPEKAEHLDQEDMVALSLLVRDFKLLSDTCINLCTHMLFNIPFLWLIPLILTISRATLGACVITTSLEGLPSLHLYV